MKPLQTVGRLLEFGIDLERLAEVGDGARGVAKPLADEPACREGGRRMRIERDGAIDVGEGICIVAGKELRPGAIVVGGRIVGDSAMACE